MDQLVLSNGRPINVNEYPLSLKPIANDIRRVTQRRPAGLSLPASLVPIEISHRIEITITSRENEFPSTVARYRQKHFPPLRGDGRCRLSVCPLSEFQLAVYTIAIDEWYAWVQNVQGTRIKGCEYVVGNAAHGDAFCAKGHKKK